jgi:hypothetical protein
VPASLERARDHAETRIAIDSEVIDYVTSGMDTESNAAVRLASGELVETLRRIREVHLDLARRAGGARTISMRAQISQVFTRPQRLRLLNLEQELFHPVLALSEAQATAVTDVFGDRILGLRVPRLLQLDNLVGLSPRPAADRRAVDYVPEDPGDVDEVNLQSYPPAVIAAATRILRQTERSPIPLSRLVDDAAAVPAGDVDGAVDDVVELVTLSALWAYAPDSVDPEEERSNDLESLVAALSAQRVEATVDRPTVWGDELMISFTETAGA